MKFLNEKIEKRQNGDIFDFKDVTVYVFKKGKYNKRNLEEADLDYITWILNNVYDLEEKERLIFEKRALELRNIEEEKSLDKDIEKESIAIAKLKEEIEALKVQNSVLADKKEELKALKVEKEKLINEKRVEERKTKEALGNIGIDFEELEEAIDNILLLANRESFVRASTKKEIQEEIEKFDKAAEALEQVGLKSKYINRVCNIKINRLKDRDAAVIKDLTSEDFMKVEEL